MKTEIKKCPHRFFGFGKCIGQKCVKFIAMNTKDKDGKNIEVWNCSDFWTTILLVEIRQTFEKK